MRVIEGAQGEGGGQILRSSITLSILTGTPFQITSIRAGRRKPGLMRQHLTAVNAAREISGATVEGAVMGSQSLTFHPGEVQGGEYHFAVGTAGSATLVLQTILPTLLIAKNPSKIVLEGGTHNPYAPPYPFLEKAFLPLLSKMGAGIAIRLERAGFYPAGGGKFVIEINPVEKLKRLEILGRGVVVRRQARAIVSALPGHIAERELAVIEKQLGWEANCLQKEVLRNPRGPGNILSLEVESENVTEVFTGFGEVKKSAEMVAEYALRQAKKYLRSNAAIGRFLADQLIIPMAMAGGGEFSTLPLSRHTETNINITKTFLDIDVTIEPSKKYDHIIRIEA